MVTDGDETRVFARCSNVAEARRTAACLNLAYPTPDHDMATLEHGTVVLSTHVATKCEGQDCCIHNMSDHRLRTWPQRWSEGEMWRVCPCGNGHPDPDAVSYQLRQAIGYGVSAEPGEHRCCGCCRPNPLDKSKPMGVPLDETQPVDIPAQIAEDLHRFLSDPGVGVRLRRPQRLRTVEVTAVLERRGYHQNFWEEAAAQAAWLGVTMRLLPDYVHFTLRTSKVNSVAEAIRMLSEELSARLGGRALERLMLEMHGVVIPDGEESTPVQGGGEDHLPDAGEGDIGSSATVATLRAA